MGISYTPPNSGGGSGDLVSTNNLSDVASAATSRTNLGVGTGDSPQFAGVNVGNASDTTVTRAAAGRLAVEGAPISLNVAKQVSANYTLGTDDNRELYGGVLHVTENATITLPAVGVGMNFAVVVQGDKTVSVDPNASDSIVLDGVALDDGDKVTSLGAAGDTVVFSYYSSDGWSATSNGWTDGN